MLCIFTDKCLEWREEDFDKHVWFIEFFVKFNFTEDIRGEQVGDAVESHHPKSYQAPKHTPSTAKWTNSQPVDNDHCSHNKSKLSVSHQA